MYGLFPKHVAHMHTQGTIFPDFGFTNLSNPNPAYKSFSKPPYDDKQSFECEKMAVNF